MDFPEPTQWNGADDRPIGGAKNQPEPWKCLECPAGGSGVVKRSEHWYATRHHIVWGRDPRAKDAPRASAGRK
jgi:hypothetical protein